MVALNTGKSFNTSRSQKIGTSCYNLVVVNYKKIHSKTVGLKGKKVDRYIDRYTDRLIDKESKGARERDREI